MACLRSRWVVVVMTLTQMLQHITPTRIVLAYYTTPLIVAICSVRAYLTVRCSASRARMPRVLFALFKRPICLILNLKELRCWLLSDEVSKVGLDGGERGGGCYLRHALNSDTGNGEVELNFHSRHPNSRTTRVLAPNRVAKVDIRLLVCCTRHNTDPLRVGRRYGRHPTRLRLW